jgi:hypothetical protein
MRASIDDRAAVAIAYDSVIARALSSLATTIARAWHTSAVRRGWQRMLEVFTPLTATERWQCGFVALAAAVVTRLVLLLL